MQDPLASGEKEGDSARSCSRGCAVPSHQEGNRGHPEARRIPAAPVRTRVPGACEAGPGPPPWACSFHAFPNSPVTRASLCHPECPSRAWQLTPARGACCIKTDLNPPCCPGGNLGLFSVLHRLLQDVHRVQPTFPRKQLCVRVPPRRFPETQGQALTLCVPAGLRRAAGACGAGAAPAARPRGPPRRSCGALGGDGAGRAAPARPPQPRRWGRLLAAGRGANPGPTLAGRRPVPRFPPHHTVLRCS